MLIQGGNGVAFWFTTGKEKSGPVFGNDDAFDGLLVAFDTADVANERYSPIITASLNDGKKSQKKVGSCFRDFRNTPGPVWARISYRNKKLVVSVDLLSEGKAFSDCFSIDEISLPDSGYFGISSSTADDYYDDHDVFSLETYQLDAPPKEKVKRPTEDKHIKNKDEFKLDDKTKEKIKKITEEYKSSVPKPNQGGFQEAINIHTIQKLQENQFKIIEALNLVHRILIFNIEKLDLPLVQHSNSEPKVGELDQIKSMLSNLTSSVLELSEIVKLAFSRSSNTDPNVVRYVDQHMDKLHEKLDGTKKVIDESKGSMFMYLLWFLVGCVVMWVIRLVRKGTEKSKKFI